MVISEIPNNATKCCSACFSRISRRLAPYLTGGTEASEDGADPLLRQWTDEELEQLRKALREYGTNWPKIAEQIPGKTSQQCKNYYFAYRKKLSFDQVVSEYYTLLGEERRPPYVTDEEESGSSTSSCDELAVSSFLQVMKKFFQFIHGIFFFLFFMFLFFVRSMIQVTPLVQEVQQPP